MKSGATGVNGRSLQALMVLVASLAVILAIACGVPTPTPTPEPVDPKEELQRTVQRLIDLRSASFDLEHIVGTTNLLPGVIMHRAYGRAVVPGQFEVTVESELLFPRSYLEIGMISVDGAAYMTNVLNGEWAEVPPGSLPINLADFGSTLAGIVEKVQDPELLGEDEIGGVRAYRIAGDVMSEDLVVLVPAAATGYRVALEIWIEKETGALRQALITGQVVATDVIDAQRKLTLDDIDQPVTISPPPGLGADS